MPQKAHNKEDKKVLYLRGASTLSCDQHGTHKRSYRK